MPKYKDSPEVRAAKKERKEKLREFLQLLDVEDYGDLRSVFKEMVGEVLENGLELNMSYLYGLHLYHLSKSVSSVSTFRMDSLKLCRSNRS